MSVSESKNTLDNQHYDVVIIGAGIQGAGVAQAAAACGYKTLVIEKFPQAGMGTSCKSSKLIHGGLRYLESGQFKLVKECLSEREILLNIAPELVKLVAFYIPVYKNSLRPPWLIWIGLFIYSLFSLKKFTRLKKNEWPSLDGLKLDTIKAVFKYYDAQTDDQKLTRAVIHSAQKLGATILYDADFVKSSAQQNIHHLSYKKNQQLHSVSSRCIVNCTGPWVNSTQVKISPLLKTPPIELVAGAHIIINKAINRGIYYLEAADKRAVFVMPWKNASTLIGTTERLFTADVDNVAATEEEKNYLLQTYNQYFKATASGENITASFAGLRVLPVSEKSAFNKSRESLIIHNASSPGLITLIGGKLTAYRASSEDVLGEIKKLLGTPEKPRNCDTKKIPL